MWRPYDFGSYVCPCNRLKEQSVGNRSLQKIPESLLNLTFIKEAYFTNIKHLCSREWGKHTLLKAKCLKVC